MCTRQRVAQADVKARDKKYPELHMFDVSLIYDQIPEVMKLSETRIVAM